MKVSVKVKPASSREKVEAAPDGSLQVWVRAKAHEGKANEAVIAALSRHYDIPKSRITLLKGHSSKLKVIEIL
jgi:uncharacterized protein